jgi:hypothetical protein
MGPGARLNHDRSQAQEQHGLTGGGTFRSQLL